MELYLRLVNFFLFITSYFLSLEQGGGGGGGGARFLGFQYFFLTSCLCLFFFPLKLVGRLCQRVHESGEFGGPRHSSLLFVLSHSLLEKFIIFISLGYIVGKFALDNMVCGWCCKCGILLFYFLWVGVHFFRPTPISLVSF